MSKMSSPERQHVMMTSIACGQKASWPKPFQQTAALVELEQIQWLLRIGLRTCLRAP